MDRMSDQDLAPSTTDTARAIRPCAQSLMMSRATRAEAAQHILDAQASVLTLDRPGARMRNQLAGATEGCKITMTLGP